MTVKRNTITQGVSWEPDLLQAAKRVAKERRQSLSAYVQTLIHADLSCDKVPTTEQPTEEEPCQLTPSATEK